MCFLYFLSASSPSRGRDAFLFSPPVFFLVSGEVIPDGRVIMHLSKEVVVLKIIGMGDGHQPGGLLPFSRIGRGRPQVVGICAVFQMKCTVTGPQVLSFSINYR